MDKDKHKGNNGDRLEDFLKQGLEGYTDTPSNKVWAGIDKGLSASPDKSPLFSSKWMGLVSSAAVMLILGIGTFIYFNQKINHLESKVLQQTEQIKAFGHLKNKTSDSQIDEQKQSSKQSLKQVNANNISNNKNFIKERAIAKEESKKTEDKKTKILEQKSPKTTTSNVAPKAKKINKKPFTENKLSTEPNIAIAQEQGTNNTQIIDNQNTNNNNTFQVTQNKEQVAIDDSKLKLIEQKNKESEISATNLKKNQGINNIFEEKKVIKETKKVILTPLNTLNKIDKNYVVNGNLPEGTKQTILAPQMIQKINILPNLNNKNSIAFIPYWQTMASWTNIEQVKDHIPRRRNGRSVKEFNEEIQTPYLTNVRGLNIQIPVKGSFSIETGLAYKTASYNANHSLNFQHCELGFSQGPSTPEDDHCGPGGSGNSGGGSNGGGNNGGGSNGGGNNGGGSNGGGNNGGGNNGGNNGGGNSGSGNNNQPYTIPDKMHFQYSLNTSRSVHDIELSVSKNTDNTMVIATDGELDLNIQTQTSTKYLSFPLLVNFSTQNPKWNIKVKTGIVGDYELSRQIEIVSVDSGSFLSINAEKPPTVNHITSNKWSLNYLAGIGMEHKFNSKLALSITPVVSGSLLSNQNTKYIETNYFSAGINTGLVCRF